MDFDAFVQSIAQTMGWAVETIAKESHQLTIPIPGGRHQRVTVTPGSDPDCQPMLFIWSEIGDAAELGDPLRLLQVNAGLEYGALAVHQGALFLRETLRLTDLDPGVAARTVYHIAVAADELERYAYGEASDLL